MSERKEASGSSSRPPAHQPAGGPIVGMGEFGEGAYNPVIPEEAIMDWRRIRRICARESLGKLDRHPNCQKRYDDWAGPIRKKYGGLEAYIKHYRLHWDTPKLPEGFRPERPPTSKRKANGGAATTSAASLSILDVSGNASIAPTHPPFEDDDEEEGGEEASWHGYYHFHPSMPLSMARTIPNDWPYGVPGDCGHYVVWCRLPIVHPALFRTEDTPFAPGLTRDALYEAVASDGIRGFTGAQNEHDEEEVEECRVIGEHTVALLRQSHVVETITPAGSGANTPAGLVTPLSEDGPSAPQDAVNNGLLKTAATTLTAQKAQGSKEHAVDLAERAQAWAGRYVAEYVRQHWPEDQWECAYFCNPPHLRTVPGLSHFHVIVRRKD